MAKERAYMGIDIGKQGAIVTILPNGEILKSATPKVGTEIDVHQFAAIMTGVIDLCKDNDIELIVAMEQVHSIFGTGAKSNFSFGTSFGIVKGVLAALRVRFEQVPPKTWQKVSFLGVEKMRKPGERKKGEGAHDNKAMALLAATRLYPDIDLRKSERAEKAHDGIVDSLLIAHYMRIKYG